MELDPSSIDTIRDVLMRRWEPPREWRLSEIVNEPFSSQPPTSIPSTVVSQSVLTPPVSATPTEESFHHRPLDDDPFTRRGWETHVARRIEALKELEKFCTLEGDATARMQQVNIPGVAACGYLTLSALKQYKRPKVDNWMSQVYIPADTSHYCQAVSIYEEIAAPNTRDYIGELFSLSASLTTFEEDQITLVEDSLRRARTAEPLLFKGLEHSWEFNPTNLLHQKIAVNFPSPIDVAPLYHLYPFLCFTSLPLGCIRYWSRSCFLYNLKAALPRLDYEKRITFTRRQTR